MFRSPYNRRSSIMLGSLLVCTLAVYAVMGQDASYGRQDASYGRQDASYGRQDASYGRQNNNYGYSAYPGRGYQYYYSQLAEGRSRVAVLGANDVILNTRLDGVQIKIDLVTDFRVDFTETIYPGIIAEMDRQDERIASKTNDLKDLSVLFDEVDALTKLADNLLEDFRLLRAKRIQTEISLSELENEDIVQNQRIDDLQAQVANQFVRLEYSEGKIMINEQGTEESATKIKTLADITNAQRSETFNFDLSSENPTFYGTYSTAFASAPTLVWGITSLNAAEEPPTYDSYGQRSYSSDTDVLYGQVQVTGDENSFHAVLSDSSQQFSFNKVSVRVTAFFIDNQEIPHDDLVWNG